MTIERLRTKSDEVALAVTMNDANARAYLFDDVLKLTRFKNDMEQFLVRTGWTLMEFSPERRRGRDRRHFPRLTERRRWWTDAIWHRHE